VQERHEGHRGSDVSGQVVALFPDLFLWLKSGIFSGDVPEPGLWSLPVREKPTTLSLFSQSPSSPIYSLLFFVLFLGC
jgi:hypothetical protein